MTIRSHCKDLLGTVDYIRYHELCNRDVFNYKAEDNRLSKWKKILDKCDPDNKDIRSSDYKGQAQLRDDIEKEAKVMRERVIAYDQLKAFSVYWLPRDNYHQKM